MPAATTMIASASSIPSRALTPIDHKATQRQSEKVTVAASPIAGGTLASQSVGEPSHDVPDRRRRVVGLGGGAPQPRADDHAVCPGPRGLGRLLGRGDAEA